MITLLKVNESISLEACADGLRFTSAKGNLTQFLVKKPSTLMEKKLFSIFPILLEMEIAEQEQNSFFIANENIDVLYGESLKDDDSSIGDELTSILPPKIPFTLDIENTAFLASSQLEYRLRFYHGAREVHPSRYGRFLKRGSYFYLLPYNLYKLCEAVEQFNALPSEERTTETNYQYFSQIKLLGEDEVQLSETMQREKILIPQQVGLLFETDNDGRLYVYPELEGISHEAFKEQFLAHDVAQRIYQFSSPDGGRKRIVISPEIQDAMNHMRHHLMGLRGEEKDRVLLKPQDVFAEVCPPETLKTNLDDFGPRVIGIGPYVYQPVPKLKQNNRPKILGDWDASNVQSWEPVLEAVTGDGEIINIPLQDGETIARLRQQVQAALLENKPSIEIDQEDGNNFKLNPTAQLAQKLERLSQEYHAKTKPAYKTKDEQAQNYVLIDEHLEEVNFTETSPDNFSIPEHNYERPNSLTERLDENEFDLKPFQKYGVSWLQANFVAGRSGVLLADDMGLGKTLQVLTFLAWLIEKGWKNNIPNNDPLWHQEAFEQGYPYTHPILVVTPITLLENWENEIPKFFKSQGEIFSPFIKVDSSNIRSFLISEDLKGREYKTGYASLNLDLLKRFKLIITNYDTVKNYQHSFGRVRWSALVTDEAQEIKNPKPDVTRALKEVASNSRFKIAMTGTPIENTLLDLWCIMDFCSPGLLGSAKAFRTTYENEDSRLGLQEAIAQLREVLQHNQGHSSYVLSRFKEDYLKEELPTKIVDNAELPVAACFKLSVGEWQTVEDLFRAGLKIKKRGKHFEVIHQLAKFYQHPALLQENWHQYSIDELLRMSSKFNWLYQCLQTIQRRSEKVLIFTRSVDMQQLIRQLLIEKFDIMLAPINGQAKSTARTGQSERHKTLQAFKNTPGFCTLILSPEVAGVGLNIVEANHVIHYGRWWNPALEDQATCRAYRLGQKKNVYVYYPISQAPIEGKVTFDETLHQLLAYKSGLRHDFLVPTDACFVNEEDVLNSMYQQVENMPDTAPFTWADLDTIDGLQFEALVSLLLRAQGYHTLLTPRSNDYGADVIATKENISYLVQCKKGLPDINVVEELNAAFDSYIQWIPRGHNIAFGLVYPHKTNRQLTGLSKKANREIRLWDMDMLRLWLANTFVTRADILVEDMQRISSAKDVANFLGVEPMN